jgi:outer membrane protein with beta-barrel domain
MKQPPGYLLLVLIAMVVGNNMQVKAQSASQFWLGVHGGIDVASFFYDPELPREVILGSKTGLAIGAEADYWFSNMYGVCAQVAYVEKGAQSEIDVNVGGMESHSTYVANFSYLQIPLLFKAALGGGEIRPIFIIGPEVGLKLSATTTTRGANSQETTIHLPDSEVTSINVGILVGVGLSQNLNPTTQLYLTAAYDYGLTNLNGGYGKEDEGVRDNQKTFSRDFRVSIGLLFALSGADAPP